RVRLRRGARAARVRHRGRDRGRASRDRAGDHHPSLRARRRPARVRGRRGSRARRDQGRPAPLGGVMDFEVPDSIAKTLAEIDDFIDREIRPLEQADDNIRFFDHRREHARTDWDGGGVPRAEWEDLLREMRRRADAAGWLRWALPSEYGGHDASNLEMAIIREHLATKGLGLHNDLQNESSIIGNFPTVLMMRDFGTDEQRAEWMPGFLDGTRRLAFGLT